MPTPQITTVIPTFRRPAWLKRAVESVLAQTFTDFRILICDNASGDETEALVTDYMRGDGRITYVKNSENVGPVNNMRQGVERVTTPYYSLLNDDDFLLPDFFERTLSQFRSHPQAGFVCAKTMVIDLSRNRISYLNRNWEPGLYTPSIETIGKMRRAHFALPSVLFSTHLKDRIRAIEIAGSDILHMTIAATQCPFVVVDSYQAAFLVHGRSYSEAGSFASVKLDNLYAAMIDTVGKIAKLDADNSLKVYLLSIVMNDYFKLFEARKLELLTQGQDPDAAPLIAGLPSRITRAGMMSHVYASLPSIAHPVLTAGIRSVSALSSLRLKRSKKVRHVPGRIIPMTSELQEYFSRFDSDIGKFRTALRSAEQHPAAAGQKPLPQS